MQKNHANPARKIENSKRESFEKLRLRSECEQEARARKEEILFILGGIFFFKKKKKKKNRRKRHGRSKQKGKKVVN